MKRIKLWATSRKEGSMTSLAALGAKEDLISAGDLISAILVLIFRAEEISEIRDLMWKIYSGIFSVLNRQNRGKEEKKEEKTSPLTLKFLLKKWLLARFARFY